MEELIKHKDLSAHYAATLSFSHSNKPPEHFEQFIEELMRELDCDLKPISYACELCYNKILRRIQELEQKVIDLQLEQQELEGKREEIRVYDPNENMQQLIMQSFNDKTRADMLERRGDIEEKRLAELYELRKEHMVLLNKYDQATVRIKAEHFELAKMEEILDNANFLKIELEESLDLANRHLHESEAIICRYVAVHNLWNEETVIKLNEEIRLMKQDLEEQQTLNSLEEQKIGILNNEVEDLNAKLAECHMENEELRREFHFYELECEPNDSGALAAAYNEISSELRTIKAEYDGDMYHYKGVIVELNKREDRLLNEMAGLKTSVSAEQREEEIDIIELERKLEMKEGEKVNLCEEHEQQLKEVKERYTIALKENRVENNDGMHQSLLELEQSECCNKSDVTDANIFFTELIGMLWSICKIAKIDPMAEEMEQTVRLVLEFLYRL